MFSSQRKISKNAILLTESSRKQDESYIHSAPWKLPLEKRLEDASSLP